jgi:hypothetical protein
MPWFQMDDGTDTESRVMQAGTAAFGLYARCGVWVARNLTDGFVPAEVAALYGTREWIDKLVATGLWSRVDGGFGMPDFLEKHKNPSAEKIASMKAAAADRQARMRDRSKSRRDSRVNNGSGNGVSHTTHSPPPLKGEGTGGAALRDGAAPPPPARIVTLTSGRVVCSLHQTEVAEGQTCRGCAADAAVADDFDLDQRPPVHNSQQRPNLVAAAALDPHGDGTTTATPADAAAEYAAAQRDLATSGDAAWWRNEARRVLGERGHVGPKRELVTVTAAELYRRAAEGSS